MLKYARYSFALIVCLAVSTAEQSVSGDERGPVAKPEDGLVTPRQYVNLFFGFSMPLPEGVQFRDSKLPAIHDASIHVLTSFEFMSVGLPIGVPRPKLSTLMVFARESRRVSPAEIQADAAKDGLGKLAAVRVGGREFWRGESQHTTDVGRALDVGYYTVLDSYILWFQVFSFDQKLARRLVGSVESVTFFDAQQARDAAGLGSRPILSELDPGVVSGEVYSNPTLRLSFRVPPGWRVLEQAEREKHLELCCRAYSAAVPPQGQALDGAPEQLREHEMLRQCSRILLWAAGDLKGSRNGDPSAAVGLIAFNSGCFPGIVFPESAKGRENVNEIVRTMFPVFAFPWARDSIQEVKAESAQKQPLLETRVQVDATQPGRAPLYQHNLVLLADRNKYWVAWRLIGYNAPGVEELPKLPKQMQIQFF